MTKRWFSVAVVASMLAAACGDNPQKRGIPSDAGGMGEVTETIEVTIVEPQSDELIRDSADVRLSLIGTESPERVELSVDGEKQTELTEAPWAWTWDTGELDSGEYTLKATAYTPGGESDSDEVTVTVDHSSAMLQLFEPDKEELYAEEVPVALAIDPKFNTQKVEVKVDGEVAETLMSAPWRTTLDATKLDGGKHQLGVKAVDGAGREATAETSFQIDHLPEIEFLEPKDGTTLNRTTKFKVRASDDVGVESVVLASDKTGPVDLFEPGTNDEWSYNWLPRVSSGTKVAVTATATDSAGRTAKASIEVTVECPEDGCKCNFLGKSDGVCVDQTLKSSGECSRPATYEPSSPTEMACDGNDNDCDGHIDEGCKCDYMKQSEGVCRTDRDEKGQCTQPQQYESKESTCDGLDNDCNGVPDEWDIGCKSARVQGTPDKELIKGADVDKSDHIWVAGITGGTFAGQMHTGLTDVFIAEFDKAGARKRAKVFGTKRNDTGTDIAVAGTSGVYVGGWTLGDMGGQTNAGQMDGFVTRFDASGKEKWTRMVGQGDNDQILGVAADGSGGVYAVGFGGGNLGGQTNAGRSDAVLARFDSSGKRQWLRLLGGSNNDKMTSVATGPSGNVYVVGRTFGNFVGQTPVGGWDVFVAKYDATGQRQWVKLLGSTSHDSATGIAVSSSGAIYISGETNGDFGGQTNSGKSDLYVAKLDASGTRKWVKLLGSAEQETAANVAMGSMGAVYVGGSSYGTLGMKPNQGVRDGFIVQLDASGKRTGYFPVASSLDDTLQTVVTGSMGTVFGAGGTNGHPDGGSNAGSGDLLLMRVK